MQRDLWNRDHRGEIDGYANQQDDDTKQKAGQDCKDVNSNVAQQNNAMDSYETTEESTTGDCIAEDSACVESSESEGVDTRLPLLPMKALTQERITKLNRLGFVWCVRGKQYDDHWNEMYRQVSTDFY